MPPKVVRKAHPDVSEKSLSAASLGEVAAPLQLYPGWLPDEPRPIISDCVIHDVGDPLPDRPGAVLLLVGARPSSPETVAAVQEAGRRRYACVVVKARGEEINPILATAEEADVPLMVAADEASWRDVDRMVTALVDAQDSRSPAYAQVRPGDLFALANAIAHSVGGATVIEDVNGLVFAHSNLPHQKIDDIRLQSITHRMTPTYKGDPGRYLEVRNASEPVAFESQDAEFYGRLGMAVRAGGELLGLIWVLNSDPPLGESAPQALQDAATLTALHLLQIRQQENGDRWRRGEALASLLSGRISASVATTLIGVPLTTSCAVLAISTRAPTDESALGVARTIDIVNLYAEAWHPLALAAAVDDTIFAVLPTPTGAPRGRSLAGFARDLAGTVERTNGVSLRIGIGPVTETLDGLPESRRLAELTLAALGQGPTTSAVGTIEDLRSRVVLGELAGRGVLDTSLPGDPLQGLLEHDRDRNTTYAESLLAYLDSFGDTSSAAKSLNVHENTLRYRIRRLQELFSIDLSDPNTRLVIWLQLRLSEI